MNKHLEPVFNILLSGLEKSDINYWVYGGISIAAVAGKFIRFNQDVDIFVKEEDFQKTNFVLEDICRSNSFSLINCAPLRKTGRPKIDIRIDKAERLSIVPVYLKDKIVEFKFWKGSEEYSYDILERVERNICGYKFFTPKDVHIKKLFLNYLSSRKDKKNTEKLKIDAKSILTDEEFSVIYK